MALKTSQLRAAASRHRLLGPKFGGVFACDELPSIATKQAYIVNLDPAHKPGTHWVSVFFDPVKAEGEYFDSYGMPLKNIHIIRFLRRNCIFKKYNTRVLQAPCSEVCGHYTLYHLYHRAAGTPLTFLQKHFHPMHKSINDRKVVRFAKKHFRVHTRHPYVNRECIEQYCRALLT